MALRLGIGIITFNRGEMLRRTLERVRRYTSHADTIVLVADDGSADQTAEIVSWFSGTILVGGGNRGVAWNKNRALYALFELQRCDIVILLEDDTMPTTLGWELAFMQAVLRWGHVSHGDWTQAKSGKGTPAEPYICPTVSAQAASFSREAILFGGYFDSRFKGYGWEHVEHSFRLARAGYGTPASAAEGEEFAGFLTILGGVELALTSSWTTQESVERNFTLYRELVLDHSYRAPWRDEVEMELFRSEMRQAKPRIL